MPRGSRGVPVAEVDAQESDARRAIFLLFHHAQILAAHVLLVLPECYGRIIVPVNVEVMYPFHQLFNE